MLVNLSLSRMSFRMKLLTSRLKVSRNPRKLVAGQAVPKYQPTPAPLPTPEMSSLVSKCQHLHFSAFGFSLTMETCFLAYFGRPGNAENLHSPNPAALNQ